MLCVSLTVWSPDEISLWAGREEIGVPVRAGYLLVLNGSLFAFNKLVFDIVLICSSLNVIAWCVN